MKIRNLYIILLLLCAVIIVIWETDRIIEKNREIHLYGNELKKCEWVWKNWKEVNELIEDSIYFDPTYDGIYGYATSAEECGWSLVYSIHDLNGDNTPELIVATEGIEDETEDQTTTINIIYRYENGKLESDFVDRYGLEIYKDGIMEFNMRMYGDHSGVEYDYYCYMPNSGEREYLEKLGISGMTEEEIPRFFRIMDDGEQVEITREEYDCQKEIYTGAGKEELIWKDLKGFLDAGDTFETLFGRRNWEEILE